MIKLEKSRWAWVEDAEEIERELQTLEPLMSILKDHGYSATGIQVGGGCDEYDTSYQSFFAEYESWEECRTKLCPDFESEKEANKDGWYYHINFNYIEIALEGKAGDADLIYDDDGISFTSEAEEDMLEDALTTELIGVGFTPANQDESVEDNSTDENGHNAEIERELADVDNWPEDDGPDYSLESKRPMPEGFFDMLYTWVKELKPGTGPVTVEFTNYLNDDTIDSISVSRSEDGYSVDLSYDMSDFNWDEPLVLGADALTEETTLYIVEELCLNGTESGDLEIIENSFRDRGSKKKAAEDEEPTEEETTENENNGAQVLPPEDWMCCMFSETDPAAANENKSYTIIQDYGSTCNGHPLYTWGKGERYLARCKKCGKLLLIQDSEYNDFCADEDDYYTDIYPVKSAEEAEQLNSDYDGFKLETEFKRRALFITNGKANWH